MESAPSYKQDAARSIFYVWSFRWKLLIIAIVVAAAMFGVTYTMPVFYKATINCVPPKQSQLTGSIGQALGGALKDFGMSKIGGLSGEAYGLMVILESASIRDSMIKSFDLRAEYEMEDDPHDDVRKAFINNIEIQNPMEGNYQISLYSTDREKAALMAVRFVELANRISDEIARTEATKIVSYLESRLAQLDSTIKLYSDSMATFSRDYGIFSPMDQAQALAKGLAEAEYQAMTQEVTLGILQQSYSADDPAVRAQHALVKDLRNRLQGLKESPGVVSNLSLKDAASVGTDFLQVFGMLEALSKLKAFIFPSLEQARLMRHQNTDILYILDQPLIPELKAKPKRMLLSFGAFVGTLVTGILLLLVRYRVRLFTKESSASQ